MNAGPGTRKSKRCTPQPTSKRLRVEHCKKDFHIDETPPTKRQMRSPSKVVRKLLTSTPVHIPPPCPPSGGFTTPKAQMIRGRAADSQDKTPKDQVPRVLVMESSPSKGIAHSSKKVVPSSTGKASTPAKNLSASRKKAAETTAHNLNQELSPNEKSSFGGGSQSGFKSSSPKKTPFKSKAEEEEWDKAKEEFQKHQQEYFSKIDHTPL
uniref:Uncharacterized protein n=1 Tax=Eutreptiella gymnastica TaxID=73025 RepID=A0A7S1IHI1_9EUGL|mmetsp:Transcript_18938/g.33495  ORF Transcript_18938/g.33495 Transcript_18938/m.33495 type:complete len:209 (+) Transcript_18938:82-708(+)